MFIELQTREEKSAKFFEWEEEVDTTTLGLEQQWTQQDNLFVQDNFHMVNLREKEIDRILQSIHDLNTIFKVCNKY